MYELSMEESQEISGGLTTSAWLAIAALALEAAKALVEAGYQFGKDLADHGC